MRRPTPRSKRVVAGCTLTVCLVTLAFVACSDHAGLPKGHSGGPAPSSDRTYRCDDIPKDPERLGGDTFAELYRDIFAVNGVAKCQSSGCHGNATGQNGLAMHDPSTGPRGVYCGMTTHFRSDATRAKPCRDPGGLDCECKVGDICHCIAGPNKGLECCNASSATDTRCSDDPKSCRGPFCHRLVATPHADGSPSEDDSDLDEVLSPSKDGEPAFMPLELSCNGNRKLFPGEVARIKSWLHRGAPFDGEGTADPVSCASLEGL